MQSISNIYPRSCNKFRKLIVGFVGGIALTVPFGLFGAEIAVTASLSADSVMMGKVINYNYEIKNGTNLNGNVEVLDSLPDVDIISRSKTEEGNDITGSFAVQPFSPGSYNLPPIAFVTATDTVFSNSPSLTVTDVDVSHLETINENAPNEDVVERESKWYDSLPDFITDIFAKYWLWIIISLLIIAGGIYAYLIYSKKIKVPFFTKKVEPPYVVAIRELSQLKDDHVWEKGFNKEYYTRLTDILRQYIDRRFGINAKEMTSSQLLKAIRDNQETHIYEEELRPVLELSDFVKFAKSEPSADQNINSYNRTYQFVESTRPVENPEDGSSDLNKKESKPSKNKK